MKALTTGLGIFALLFATAALAEDDPIFEAGDHCVAYRTTKDIFFALDAEIIGRNCEVTASLVPSEGEAGPSIVVEVPIERFKSRNFMRDRSVSDLLGAKTQPDLRFTSSPIDAEAIREEVATGHLTVSGVLTIGGKDFPLEFPLEIAEHEGKHFVAGRLPTTFAAFEIEVPTVAGGLIARPHESLELVVHLELERVEGLADWAEERGLR
jgi:polyisoprenoid-binding protein YceI